MLAATVDMFVAKKFLPKLSSQKFCKDSMVVANRNSMVAANSVGPTLKFRHEMVNSNWVSCYSAFNQRILKLTKYCTELALFNNILLFDIYGFFIENSKML
jgi:hypothetical protein